MALETLGVESNRAPTTELQKCTLTLFGLKQWMKQIDLETVQDGLSIPSDYYKTVVRAAWVSRFAVGGGVGGAGLCVGAGWLGIRLLKMC